MLQGGVPPTSLWPRHFDQLGELLVTPRGEWEGKYIGVEILAPFYVDDVAFVAAHWGPGHLAGTASRCAEDVESALADELRLSLNAQISSSIVPSPGSRLGESFEERGGSPGRRKGPYGKESSNRGRSTLRMMKCTVAYMACSQRR